MILAKRELILPSRRAIISGAAALAMYNPAEASIRRVLKGSGGGGNFPGAPASVIAPVTGSSLLAVWNKQNPASTGPQNTFSNGTWSGSLDAYLISVGFINGGGGNIHLPCGSTAKAIQRYDFTGAPKITFGGTAAGSANFTDCKFTGVNKGLAGPSDSNANLDFSTQFTVNCVDCWWDYANNYTSCGNATYTNCKFTNQPEFIAGSGVSAGPTSIIFEGCYIPGGGCNPSSHNEYIQQIPSTPVGSVCRVRNCMLDANGNNQYLLPDWGSAWTAMWSVGVETIEFTNNIVIGMNAVNAPGHNTQAPNIHDYIVALGTGCTLTMTNNCMENPASTAGNFGGYTNGAGTRIDGGGNRNFNTNTAVTTF